jgi:hypothetical protein
VVTVVVVVVVVGGGDASCAGNSVVVALLLLALKISDNQHAKSTLKLRAPSKHVMTMMTAPRKFFGGFFASLCPPEFSIMEIF